ncbi:alpha/beta hydrolase [Paenibacillus sp. PK3_47]|uniref:alpha/beta hydrolase n=1 Tax=Paenibacillus sp. PK3_47 TaxID=2072642 RepID=UPI00201DF099|nr:alpha/beta hydrolase [Paenibacillus sp. PK3_47]
MAFFMNGSINLHYEYEPARSSRHNTETLVLIHGYGFDLRSWDLIVPYMRENYNILRYDFRGHGLSSTGEIDTGRLAWIYVEHLHSLLNHLKIDKFHFVSHGAGCIIALYFRKVYPHKVDTNVLLSLPLFNSTGTAYKYADYRKSLMTHQSMRALADHVIPNVTLYPQDSPEVSRLYEAFSKVTFDVYIELVDFFASAHNEVMELFKEDPGPTLLLTGERDPMYPPYLSSLIASANPNCRFMTIYNSSNMVFYDQPEETFKQIRVFFDSERSRPAPLDPLLLELHADFYKMVSIGQETDPPAIRLKVTLLRTFQVILDGEPVVSGWGRRSAKELLIYLLLNPAVPRDRLCEELWSDMDPAKARNQLRVCLTHLKQLLNNEITNLVYSDNQQITLQQPADCDLLQLLEDLNSAQEEEDPEQKGRLLQPILQIIDGDIFRNLHQDWNQNLRTRIEIQLTALAHQHAEYLTARGSFADAIAVLKYVLLLNPEEYDAYERIAGLYELGNQKHEAKKWRSRLDMLHQDRNI